MLVMSVVRGSVQLGAMTAMSLRICNVELATTARVTEGLGYSITILHEMTRRFLPIITNQRWQRFSRLTDSHRLLIKDKKVSPIQSRLFL